MPLPFESDFFFLVFGAQKSLAGITRLVNLCLKKSLIKLGMGSVKADFIWLFSLLDHGSPQATRTKRERSAVLLRSISPTPENEKVGLKRIEIFQMLSSPSPKRVNEMNTEKIVP